MVNSSVWDARQEGHYVKGSLGHKSRTCLKQMNKQTEKLTGLNLHKNKESDELRKN